MHFHEISGTDELNMGRIARTQCVDVALFYTVSHVAWSVRLCVCVLGIRVNCAQTVEPIEMSLCGKLVWTR